MALPHPSEFADFTSDYDKVNRIDTPSYTKKKVYDATPYLVFSSKNFTIKLGETRPLLTCFLKVAGEQFGDPITPLTMEDYTINFRCVDDNNNTIIIDTATITNVNLGEISYEFKALDFSKPGRYYGEFEFTDTNVSPAAPFTLPGSNERIEIIVS